MNKLKRELLDSRSASSLDVYLQRIYNHAVQGHCRYGKPDKSRSYLKRLKAELSCYCKTGNAEHLYNIGVYCWLETVEPQHKNFHYDPYAKSATRPRD
jgi:pentatricopeptide repeat protein